MTVRKPNDWTPASLIEVSEHNRPHPKWREIRLKNTEENGSVASSLTNNIFCELYISRYRNFLKRHKTPMSPIRMHRRAKGAPGSSRDQDYCSPINIFVHKI
ncbi:hypothetical protein TNCV_4685201 [Trichonephila clavipes]|nr:hypothetical protein TNCV_4685201 [Trichonephila clavipes]